jgi:regulator of PEP synthase PpsR (kinase-PPPase family)
LLLVLSEGMVSETASLLVRSLARVFTDVRNEELRYLPFAAAEMRVDWVANTMAARSRVMSMVSVEVLKSVLCEIMVYAKKSMLLSLRRNKLAASG